MRNRLKLLLWKLLGTKFQQKYWNKKLEQSKDYMRLKNSHTKKRILMLDTPEHGNLGDHAIVLSMKKFVTSAFPEHEWYEFTFSECKYCMEKIIASADDSDVILLPGGGFLGSLWPEEENNILHILKAFYMHQIIIFPQTLFFEDSEYGAKEKKRFIAVTSACRHLSVFVRDQYSYDLAKELGGQEWEQLILVPDIVTSLPVAIPSVNRKKARILLCLREDKERVLPEENLVRYRQLLEKEGFDTIITSTVLSCDIPKETRESEVARKLAQFSEAELVITDRLHGMLFSTITETPCIAFDNTSRKVSGGYQWIKQFDYIRLVRPEDLSVNLIRQLSGNKQPKYDCSCYERYYNQLKNSLASALGENIRFADIEKI